MLNNLLSAWWTAYNLLRKWGEVYNSLSNAVDQATWTKDTISKVYNKTKKSVNDWNEKYWNNSIYFDTSRVKSTVTNPSNIFKWISTEDEQKILKIVNDMYPTWSWFEKQQAIQSLYNVALNEQKQKDIDAGRQEIKLDLINKANNAKSPKEKNTYNSQVKKADLADLIKDQLEKQWYNREQFMNIKDDWIIAWFLETNPEYKDTFNKYFYNSDDAIKLWKDLWWIEKTHEDEVWDKVEWIAEWFVWWLPKRWEWVRDLLDRWLAWTDYNINREKSLENTAFFNYVENSYWTVPANLSDKDLEQAKKDFEAHKEELKKNFQPTASSAFTKMAMWLSDIALTAWWLKWTSLVRNNMFKLWFSTLANDDNMSRAPEALWDALSWIGWNINELPWFSAIRDSLQTEQDKADWDAFVAWNVLALVRWGKRSFKDIKDADMQWWKKSFDEVKKWNIQEWVNSLKENAKENRATKYNEQKLKAAQEVSQWQIETRWEAAKALDQLNEEWKLTKIERKRKNFFMKKERPANIDELETNTNELVDKIKKEQTDIAKWEQKKFWQADLWLSEDAEILDNTGKKSTQKIVTYPVDSLLDRIIEHYDGIDKAEATKYKSYKQALKNWNLPAETILEIRREWNSLNQKVYNNKTNQYKDTDKAQQWATNMKKVNNVIEWLDIGEDLRKRDSQLSALYTLQQWIKDIKKAAANYEKKAIKGWWIANKIWKTTSRILSKLSFGTTNFLSKAFMSMLQESLWWWMFEKTAYNSLEIANKVPEFIKDYKNVLKKIEWEPIPKNKAVKLINSFIDKWNLEQQFNEEEED